MMSQTPRNRALRACPEACFAGAARNGLTEEVCVLFQTFYISSDKFGAVFKVLKGHDLVGRVHVAAGYRDDARVMTEPLPRGWSPCSFLETPGVSVAWVTSTAIATSGSSPKAAPRAP